MKSFLIDSIFIFWKTYTSPDSWLPLILPSLFWSSSWIYGKLYVAVDYGKWREIHRFHHIAAMGLSIFSMYFDDDAVFSERIVILWSIPYFCVDIFDLILIKDYIYILHHAMVLTLGFFNYNNPLLYEMRMNSRAVWLELSTILLHIVQNSKDPILFVVFAVTFTLCRLVWIPLGIINPLLQNGMDWYDWPIVAVSAFYGLNLYWYMKILKILFKNMNMLLSSSSPSPSSRDVIASKKASKQG